MLQWINLEVQSIDNLEQAICILHILPVKEGLNGGFLFGEFLDYTIIATTVSRFFYFQKI